MTPPTLSVVIPTYNTADLTLAACRAAVAAAPAGTEIVVVDDASTDGTAQLLEQTVPAVRIVRLERNSRFAAAANAGVDATSGAVVLLLNSDTAVHPSALKRLLASFEQEPLLGVAGCRLMNDDGSTQWSGGALPTLAWLTVMAGGAAWLVPRRHRATERRTGGAVGWVSGAAMAFRRSVWDVAGPLSNRYRFYAQDLEFCVRAKDAGWKIRIIDDALVVHAGGASVRKWREHVELAHDPALLWGDLLRWAAWRNGRSWAAAARLLMLLAAAARVTARRLRELSLRGAKRARSRATTASYSAALRDLLRIER